MRRWNLELVQVKIAFKCPSDLSALQLPKCLRVLRSLGTDEMNEIFPCLVWYGLKLTFVVWKLRQHKARPAGKIKKYSWFILTSFCLWTSANNYIVHKLPYSSSLCTYLFYKNYCFFRSKWITIDWFQQNWNKWLVKNKVDRIKWYFSG